MTFERSDFRALAEKYGAESRRARQPEMLQLRQAAVAAEQLMGTVEWDTFLQQLSAGKEEAAKLRQRYMADLEDPRLVDPNLVALKRIAIIRLNEKIKTIADIISLPTTIRKQGALADNWLKEFAKLDEEEKTA